MHVIEAKDRVGGRTLTVNLKTANGTDQWDLGGKSWLKSEYLTYECRLSGQWVGITQSDLLNLMQELNVEYYPQYTSGKKLAQIGGVKIRPYNATLPSSNELRLVAWLIPCYIIHLWLRQWVCGLIMEGLFSVNTVFGKASTSCSHLPAWRRWQPRFIFLLIVSLFGNKPLPLWFAAEPC